MRVAKSFDQTISKDDQRASRSVCYHHRSVVQTSSFLPSLGSTSFFFLLLPSSSSSSSSSSLMSSSLSHAIPFFSSSFSSSSSSSSSSSDTKLFHSAHTCTSPWKKKKTKTKKEERSMRLVCARSSSSSTLYDLLEIPPHVGLSDIKQAYRQLALRYHPDVCSSHLTEESTRRFIEIQEAYETLSDPRRRAIYDHATSMGRATGGRIYKVKHFPSSLFLLLQFIGFLTGLFFL